MEGGKVGKGGGKIDRMKEGKKEALEMDRRRKECRERERKKGKK